MELAHASTSCPRQATNVPHTISKRADESPVALHPDSEDATLQDAAAVSDDATARVGRVARRPSDAACNKLLDAVRLSK